ncbi:adenylyltransferase [Betaproteobacteria bacterium]|nr:adenylyltransferase [Betaproteobacteria bacterium]GHT89662.1 adenylyltransferase [Betaproteobacteria bacterium]
MNDGELLRYSRHILLNELGVIGQERILDARALIIGAGGLGSPAALYLAAAGVGTLVIADGDTVDASNLQRQILHTESRLGENKARSAQATLAALNPQTQVIPICQRLADEALAAEIRKVDVVLDCSDNFATRHAINRACVQYKKPLVSGAAIGFEGQISVFDLRMKGAPCYHCLFPDGEDVTETRCALMGIFAPLTGTIGSLQAGEALKLLAGMGDTLQGRLLRVDALKAKFRTVNFQRDADCAVCGREAAADSM